MKVKGPLDAPRGVERKMVQRCMNVTLWSGRSAKEMRVKMMLGVKMSLKLRGGEEGGRVDSSSAGRGMEYSCFVSGGGGGSGVGLRRRLKRESAAVLSSRPMSRLLRREERVSRRKRKPRSQLVARNAALRRLGSAYG